jgi:hypothetical protein
MDLGEVPMIFTPRLLEVLGQLERGLAAELQDHAVGLLVLHDVQQLFAVERLEVELVGGVVVGGDRLGVRVDHDRLDAFLLERVGRVAAAVVELDALADAVGSAAEDDDLLAVGADGLVLLVVGRVVVGGVGGELGGAGVNGLEHGVHAQGLARGAHLGLLGSGAGRRSADRRSPTPWPGGSSPPRGRTTCVP